jgi:hypothetical protein
MPFRWQRCGQHAFGGALQAFWQSADLLKQYDP